MSKPKIVAFIVFLVFAAAGYIYFYGDAFSKKTIQIGHTFRPMMNRRRPANPAATNPPPNNLIFNLVTGESRLTDVKLVLLDEYKTNKYTHPLWEIVSSSNSVPTKGFYYGENIRGMHPAIKDARPDPLSNGVPYRLIVQAGKLKGEHDFILNASNNVIQ